MTDITQYINEQKGMPIFNQEKIEGIWKKVKQKLGNNFTDALFDNLDLQTKNIVLWKINNEYKLNLIK